MRFSPAGRWLLCCLMLFASMGTAWSQPPFEVLLEEGGLAWKRPEQFVQVPVRQNDLMPYEMAMRSEDGQMEIRYAIRPLARIEIDYDDPHGAAPDPNHIFPLVFQVLAGKLSAGGRNPSREYPQAAAKERFNADWASAVVFDVDPAFTPDYKGGLMLALHKNRVADAYVIYLFKNYEAAKARINDNLTTLVFAETPKG